jgi:general secretion pathway protein D
LLVVSPQASYLQQASNWIERLDMAEATGDAAERLFVYRVRHGDAENLADTLSQLFGADERRSAVVRRRRRAGLGGSAHRLRSAIGSMGEGARRRCGSAGSRRRARALA